jgi:HD-GYP domain-containing protein (c-di-GMP phosphodiesterase class II)
MTLLDIHGQSRPPSVPVSPRAAAPDREAGKQPAARARATRSLALFETILDNPLLPALAFGALFHLVRFGVYFALHGGGAGFLPARPLHWFAWLPEFAVPYAALWAIAAAYRKASQGMHDRILEGLERGNEIQKVSILGFAKISEVRDPDTGDHIIRMSHYSRMLAQEMAKYPEYAGYITRTYCDEIFIAAPLHDIGKVGIRDDILKKRGGLTADEFEIMKMHTIIGGDLLHELELKLGWRTFYSLSKEIAYHHHQRFDGTGYPNVLGTTKAMFVEPGIGKPLKGKAIPLSARIVAMADVYDALVSRRCYKEPIPHAKAREMILAESGRHFDPDLAQAFLRIENDLIRVSQEFSR